MVYKTLDQLVEKGLVLKVEKPNQVIKFEPNHPSKILELLENQKKDFEIKAENLKSTLNRMVSDFNLISGKPNVQFFEGLEGVKKIMDDSLYSKEEILSYADLEAIEKHIHGLNQEYVKERDSLGIKKRIFALGTEFNKNFVKDYYVNVTNIKFLDNNMPPFHTVMQIYDGKVSYLTLSDKEMISVIIEDKHIYQMHKYLFEHLWGITG